MPQTLTAHAAPVARTRSITMEQPWQWLNKGWRDMMRNPVASLGYGALFAAIGFALVFGLHSIGLPYLILPLALGFAIVGPAVAVGLYHISARAEQNQDTSLMDALTAWRLNPGQIALMGMILLLCFIAWVRFASLLFMLFHGSAPPSIDGLLNNVVTAESAGLFLAVSFGSGAVIAFAVFAISAISVPMLIDKKVDAMTAVVTSIDAVRHNMKAMLLWAWLIALFTWAGIMFFFIGLIITLPLIGHASWHAYRDLVDR